MASVRKTKIVCTLGPAVDDPAVLRELLLAGMNVARLNMAHGELAEHAGRIAAVRAASRETGIPVSLLIDIKGPEIRTGRVPAPLRLETGSEVVITVDGEPEPGHLSISYRDLPDQVSPGNRILIADGRVDLEVRAVVGRQTRCIVVTGGEVGSHKNVNLIGVRTRLPAVTERDVVNLGFAVREGLDYVAASFVRKPDHVLEVRDHIRVSGGGLDVVAKIEDQEGLDNIDQIIRVSDGIMVARGDLGVQLPTQVMPLVQKRIILKCHEQNRAVITATQMLESMIGSPRPTRAEATDVANAIFDGTDAVMLSGETAVGRYPVEAVRTMDGIARAVEQSPEYESRVRRFFRLDDAREDTAQAVSRAAYLVARDIEAAAILTPTLRGNTPKLISRYRPTPIVIAVTPSAEVQRKLLLYWGVVPLVAQLADESDAMLTNALRAALDSGLLQTHDRIVTLAGVPVNSPVMLNMIRVHTLDTVLAKGRDGFGGYAAGRVVRVADAAEARLLLRRDGTEILLTRFLTPDYLDLLSGLLGVVVEEPSHLSPEQIQAASPDLVLISSTADALNQVEDGITVTLHGTEHVVYEGLIRKS
jgi:pyruvate kinase